MPLMGSQPAFPPPWWGGLPAWVQKIVTYYLRRAGVIPK